ncbi:late endosomal/lysosomal adaptor and MAPK and MTOR activator-domain-containing protein [Halenospora varia]|nr:late endosomal/lysosomal adaptor and MAPK and MTOR activator-domain-containing protein [Halenospora varia]
MGVCSSCLGRNGDRDLSDEDENSRLLFDDPHGHHYGSFNDQHAIVPADPQEVQRETEALQKVVAQTSNHLVDIFAMVPQNGPPAASSLFPAQDAKLLRYQDVLAKMSTHDQSIPTQVSADNTPNVSDGWLSEEDEVEEMKRTTPVKSDGIGPLLGGFADAESAME